MAQLLTLPGTAGTPAAFRGSWCQRSAGRVRLRVRFLASRTALGTHRFTRERSLVRTSRATLPKRLLDGDFELPCGRSARVAQFSGERAPTRGQRSTWDCYECQPASLHVPALVPTLRRRTSIGTAMGAHRGRAGIDLVSVVFEPLK